MMLVCMSIFQGCVPFAFYENPWPQNFHEQIIEYCYEDTNYLVFVIYHGKNNIEIADVFVEKPPFCEIYMKTKFVQIGFGNVCFYIGILRDSPGVLLIDKDANMYYIESRVGAEYNDYSIATHKAKLSPHWKNCLFTFLSHENVFIKQNPWLYEYSDKGIIKLTSKNRLNSCILIKTFLSNINEKLLTEDEWKSSWIPVHMKMSQKDICKQISKHNPIVVEPTDINEQMRAITINGKYLIPSIRKTSTDISEEFDHIIKTNHYDSIIYIPPEGELYTFCSAYL